MNIHRFKRKIFIFSLLILLVVGCVTHSDSCPKGLEQNEYGECFPPEAASDILGSNRGIDADTKSLPREEYSEFPEKFTWGQRDFFSSSRESLSNEGETWLASGISAFKEQRYLEAADFFENAYLDDENNPELLILHNNALAWEREKRITLAAVVPGDDNPKKSLEILRGVAQSQDEFDRGRQTGDSLLEIVIAKDSTYEDDIVKVAEQIANDDSIRGVVGHNSSSSSRVALPVYAEQQLVMVSPTSTSTFLNGNYFFRTVPSDSATAKKLAEYARDTLGISKVAIFYDDVEESYSKSLKEAFYKSFSSLGGNIVVGDITSKNLTSNFLDVVEKNISLVALFPDVNTTSALIDVAEANNNLPKNLRVQILGGDSLYTDDILSGGRSTIEPI